MKNIFKLRHNSRFITFLSIFVFSISALGISLLVGRIFIDNQFLDRFLVTIFYFTTQSNLLVFLIMLFVLTKQSHKRWFKFLSFIGLVDITITGLVFHLFLISYVTHINLMQHLLHTITPLLYISFYFLVFDFQFKIKSFWIGLIHPLIFLISVYTWIHPLFGNRLSSILLDFQGASYVYPFLDPATFVHGIAGLILFNFGLLMPLIILITCGLIIIKSSIEKKLK